MVRKCKAIILLLMIGSLTLFFVACSGSKNVSDTNDPNTSIEGKRNAEQHVDKKEENAVEQKDNKEEEQQEDEKAEPKLEVVNVVGEAWQDGVFANWVSTSIIVENTGDVPIKIGRTEMDFKDTEGMSLGTSSLNHAIPEVIEPGQQAYINDASLVDKDIDITTYKETEYHFSVEETSEAPHLLEVSSIDSVTSMDPLAPDYAVTGIVTNTTDEFKEEVRIAAALFAEDGSFLGILRNKMTPGLNPGDEIKLQVPHPSIPHDVFERVETIEVKAYGK